MKKRNKPKLKKELVGIFDDLIDESITPLPDPDIPEPKEIARKVVMFWREEKCIRCKRVYEGSQYGMESLLQLEMLKPKVHFGRFFGWRYVGVKFMPIPDVGCYDHLPRSVHKIKAKIRQCPRCVHTPKVIYLTQGAG